MLAGRLVGAWIHRRVTARSGTRALLVWGLARWAWRRYRAPRTIVLDPRESLVVEVTTHRDRGRSAAGGPR